MFKKSTLNNNKKEIDAKNGLNFLAPRVQSTSFQSPDVQASRVQAFRVQASRIPESNFPESECSGVQSPSVQIPSVPASGFQASRPCVLSLYGLLSTHVFLKLFHMTQVLCLFSVPMKNNNFIFLEVLGNPQIFKSHQLLKLQFHSLVKGISKNCFCDLLNSPIKVSFFTFNNTF